ncbi:hypothetical protein F53441_1105 [Fusarium austroafricanum]|uniref:DUF7730 domain-containing protein n=1 Tax=Fusarium austroafricanum TaxID=2364996 RepID=A0A8H4KWG4_9HYPO|nr:hypothetical protein F53441_1105 [Fusarium austroafricanum]
MIVFRFLWLLFGLFAFPFLSAEGTDTTTARSLLKIWDVDVTCTNERQYLEESMAIALEIVTKTHEALEFIRFAGPKDGKGKLRVRAVWKSLRAFLGIEQEHADLRREVTALFKKIEDTIPAEENNPAKGYVEKLAKLPNHKPMIACSDEPKLRSEPDFKKYLFDNVGAWVHDHRFVCKPEKREKPVICEDWIAAVVTWDKDLLMICPILFEAKWKGRPSPKAFKASGIKAGHKLREYSQHLSVTLVHELCHWFGGLIEENQQPVIDDQTAIDKYGRLLYRAGQRLQPLVSAPSGEQIETNGLRRIECCNKNADSLALFALAMYYDDWEWFNGGEAGVPGQKYESNPNSEMSYSPREPDAEELEQEWKEYWEARVKELPLLPNQRPRALTPDPPTLTSDPKSCSSQAPLPLDQSSCYWFKVPPYIRRDILRLAFRDTHLHIYMHHSHPDVPHQPDSKYHCGIVIKPESQGPMTRGGLNGPWSDDCPGGGDSAICEAWRQQDGPSACHIWVMGWLLSCRQKYSRSYLETIEVLYSTNTLILEGSRMMSFLSKLILPQRLALMNSLEITWPLKAKFIPDQSYGDLDQEHLESIFNMLSPTQFPALSRLYIWFDESNAKLAVGGLEACQKVILKHLDSFTKRMTHLAECAFALPSFLIDTIHYRATEVSRVTWEDGCTMFNHEDSYRHVWRDANGEATVVRLPYIDSYPKPPYHLLQEDIQVPGYWILEASDKPVGESTQECPYHNWCGTGSYDFDRSALIGYRPTNN